MEGDYFTNGAAFKVGKLQVTSDEMVDNLNAEKLQGKEPSDFLQTGEGFGITQSGENINIDEDVVLKIGNFKIAASGQTLKISLDE